MTVTTPRGLSAFAGVARAPWIAVACAGIGLCAGCSNPLHASKMLQLINETRAQYNLPPVRSSWALSRLAEKHSRRMMETGRMVDASDLELDLAKSRYPARVWAPNTMIFPGPVEGAHAVFMESSAPRDNIIANWAEEVGIAVISRKGRLYITVVFVQPFPRQGLF